MATIIDSKLQELLSLLNETVTKEEFLDAFKTLLSVITEIKERNHESLSRLGEKYEDIMKEAKQNHESTLFELTSKVDHLFVKEQMDKMYKEHEGMMKMINEKLKSVRDGIPGLMGPQGLMGPKGDFGSPDNPDMIKNKLQQLSGDERLGMEAIRGLKEMFDELRQRKEFRLGGGGFSKMAMDNHIIDDEVPGGSINGSNTEFTLAQRPNPTASLKVYMNGQRMKAGGEDYTLAALTITFVTAPPTNSIILCDYRT